MLRVIALTAQPQDELIACLEVRRLVPSSGQYDDLLPEQQVLDIDDIRIRQDAHFLR